MLHLRARVLSALKVCEASIESITATVMIGCWTGAHIAKPVALIRNIVNLTILNLYIWPVPHAKPARLVLAFWPISAAETAAPESAETVLDVRNRLIHIEGFVIDLIWLLCFLLACHPTRIVLINSWSEWYLAPA